MPMIVFRKSAADPTTSFHRQPHEPTEAQAVAGNYRKKHVDWRGLDISVENPSGSVRRGVDPGGKPWMTRMLCDYGYVKRSKGLDGDQVDIFLGPHMDAPMIYVIHQMAAPDYTEVDEDKIMAGFSSQADAVAVYLKHYDDPRVLGEVTAMPFDEFKRKVRATGRNGAAMIKAMGAGLVLFMKATSTKTILIPGYYKKDGSYVPPHQQLVHFDPNHDPQKVAHEGETWAHKQAHKKLKSDAAEWWDALPHDTKYALVLETGTHTQNAASANSALSVMKVKLADGVNPPPAQWKLFAGLSTEDRVALLQKVTIGPEGAALLAGKGYGPDGVPLVVEAPPAAPVAVEPPAAMAPASSDPVPAQAAPLNHGVLNIPGKTNSINAELDKYKAAQAAVEKAAAKTKAAKTKAEKAEAKALQAQHGAEIVAKMQASEKLKGFPKKQIADHLDGLVKWEPAKYIALVHSHLKEKAAAEAASAAPAGQQEGDTKPAADGGTLVLKDGHWTKQGGYTPLQVGSVLKMDSSYSKMNAGEWVVYAVSPDGALYFTHKVGAKVPNQSNSATIPFKTLHDALAIGTATLVSAPAQPEALPEGWGESTPGGMITNADPVTGGIVDQEIVSGLWFAVPNKEGLGTLEGFKTRAEALAALHSAVVAPAPVVEEEPPKSDAYKTAKKHLSDAETWAFNHDLFAEDMTAHIQQEAADWVSSHPGSMADVNAALDALGYEPLVETKPPVEPVVEPAATPEPAAPEAPHLQALHSALAELDAHDTEYTDKLEDLKNGSYYKKEAYKKLAKDPAWDSWTPKQKHDKVEALYHQLQSDATLKSAQSQWKANMMAGKLPPAAQQKAFAALVVSNHEKATAMIAEVVAAIGSEKAAQLLGQQHTAAQAMEKTPPAVEPELPAAPIEPEVTDEFPATTDPENKEWDAGPVPQAQEPIADPVPAVEETVLHNTTPGHNKSWSVKVDGTNVITKWGKIGAKQQSSMTNFMSPDAAQAYADKMKLEKLGKGYVPHSISSVHGTAPAAVAPAPVASAIDPISNHPVALAAQDIPSVPAFSTLTDAGKAKIVAIDQAAQAGDQTLVENFAYAGDPNDSSTKHAKAVLKLMQAKQSATADPGPQDGDTKQGADGMLVFKDGRWHKVEEPHPVEAVEIPDFSADPSGNTKFYVDLANQVKAAALSEGKKGFAKIFTSYADGKFSSKAAAGFKTGKFSADSHLVRKQIMHKFLTDLKAAMEIKAGKKPAKPKAKPSVVVMNPTVTTPSSIESMDGWPQVGPQGGYNEGGTFKDKDGVEWYCKFPAGGADVARNEFLALQLYKLAGVAVPEAKLISKGGKVGIASKILQGATKNEHGLKTGSLKNLFSGFAAHAWLANRDAVGNNPAAGKGFDNIVDVGGEAFMIDAGGSMHYSGTGAVKAGKFGPAVSEIEGMRNPSLNPNAAAVFGKMSEADIKASVGKVLAISDSEIKSLVAKFGPGDSSSKMALAATLIARKADLSQKFPEVAKKATSRSLAWVKLHHGEKIVHVTEKFGVQFAKIEVPAKGFNPAGIPAPYAYDKSSSQYVNAQNTADIKKIYDTAVSGAGPDAVLNLQFDAVSKQTGEKSGAQYGIDDHPSKMYVKEYFNQVVAELKAQMEPTFRMEQSGSLTATFNEIASSIAEFVKPIHFSEFKAWKKKAADYIVLDEKGGEAVPQLDQGQFHNVEPSNPEMKAFKAGSDANFAKLTQDEQQACKAYTGSAYAAWNSAMRMGEVNSSAFKAAAHMRSAFAKAALDLPEGIILHRGIDVGEDTYKSVVGAVIQDGSFQSSSYGDHAAFSGKKTQLRIHVSKGVKAVQATTFSSFSEREIILAPNTRYIVTKVTKVGGHNVVDVLALPHED